MAKTELRQTVKLFPDETILAEQIVHLDSEDTPEAGGFMSVLHDGCEFNLTVENWDKLVLLVENTKKKAGIKSNLFNNDWEDDLQP